jgi:hypothetical protein
MDGVDFVDDLRQSLALSTAAGIHLPVTRHLSLLIYGAS